MRSASPSSSGRYDDTTMIPSPAAARSPITVYSSPLAPTSMPLVGSSNTRILGLVSSQRASSTFCWFPPDKVDTGWSYDPARRRRLSSSLSASSPISLGGSSPWRDPRRRLAMVTFSLIDSSGSRPSTLRSSVSRPMPAFIMVRGPVGFTATPSTSISPATMGVAPNSDSSSSLRPEPSSPPMPRISPPRRSKSIVGPSASRCRPRTRSSGVPGSLWVSG